MVWDWQRKKGSWPTWHDLRRPLKRDLIDPELALAQLTEELLVTEAQTRTWLDGWPSGQLRLTVGALAHLPDTDAYLNSFFDLIDLLAEAEQRQASINGQPATVSASDLYHLRRKRSVAHSSPSMSLDRFVYHEPWCIGGALGNGWAGTETTIVVDHRIRAFVGCRDIHDYWQRRRSLIAEAGGRLQARSPGLDGLGPVHPEIAKAAGQLFADGHYGDAVMRAFKAVEHRVQRATGSSAIGQRLMNHAFGGVTPRLDVTHTSGSSAAGERDGYKMLFMGAMVGIRNVRAHGDHPSDQMDEARDAIAFASLLMRRVDRALSRSTTQPARAAPQGPQEPTVEPTP